MVFVIIPILQHLNLIQILQLLDLPHYLEQEEEFSWPMYSVDSTIFKLYSFVNDHWSKTCMPPS